MITRCLLTIIFVLVLAACGGEESSPESTPNIVLVTVDTLRADHLETYGYSRPTAPELTRLAAGGVRFTRAISQAPWTLPSMASVHTSLYPTQHGAIEAETALPEAAVTLAESLREVGYRTVAVVSHEFVARRHGFAQGFDVFDESNVLGPDAVTSRDLTLAALARVGETGEPFFLWVHYFDPHFTYVRHPGFGFADAYAGALPGHLTSDRLMQEGASDLAGDDLDFVKAVYDEEIAHTDEWIGKLWESLDARYGAEQTVMLLTGDHGEYFLERGRFFHGKDVYDELVRVPLVIAGAIPDELRGTVVDTPVATRSIPRTVMELVGIRRDGFDGVDLLAVARGGDADPVFTEGSHAFGTDARKLAVVDGGLKLIYRYDDDAFELYDLDRDPGERDNRWNAETAGSPDGSRLRQLLEGFRELPRLEPQAVGLTPEAIEQLRALGYIR